MVEVLITGGTGMVGKAIQSVIPGNVDAKFIGSKDCNLINYDDTRAIIERYKPKTIIHLAAKVGGVKSNTDYVADFFEQNILINTNVLMAADRNDVQNVVSLLSTCVYPDKYYVTYPLTENQLHGGPPHDSNFGYAYAKRMVEVHSRALRQQKGRNYTTAIPNNIYGPHDLFDLENGHVAPAIIRKIFEAKINNKPPVFWGNGSSLREFTFSEDIAEILLKMTGCIDRFGNVGGEAYASSEPCNIGFDNEISIKKLVDLVAKYFDYKGEIVWDETKPSGQHRKPSKTSKIDHVYTTIEEGVEITCKWFEETYPNIRGMK